MTVNVTYNYVGQEGTEVINFPDWVSTLPETEQAEFTQAARQHDIAVKLKEAAGALTVEFNPHLTYVWATAEAADAGVGTSPTWEKYHNRYLEENNIKLEITKE